MLLVYSLEASPATVAGVPRGSGIRIAQTPRDLHKGSAIPPIIGARYELALPPRGFELLEVARD